MMISLVTFLSVEILCRSDSLLDHNSSDCSTKPYWCAQMSLLLFIWPGPCEILLYIAFKQFKIEFWHSKQIRPALQSCTGYKTMFRSVQWYNNVPYHSLLRWPAFFILVSCQAMNQAAVHNLCSSHVCSFLNVATHNYRVMIMFAENCVYWNYERHLVALATFTYNHADISRRNLPLILRWFARLNNLLRSSVMTHRSFLVLFSMILSRRKQIFVYDIFNIMWPCGCTAIQTLVTIQSKALVSTQSKEFVGTPLPSCLCTHCSCKQGKVWQASAITVLQWLAHEQHLHFINWALSVHILGH